MAACCYVIGKIIKSMEPDNFELLNSRMPDLMSALHQRITSKKSETAIPTGGFDPYKMMVKRKEAETAPIDPSTIRSQWPSEDVKALEDYCQRVGIIGFGSGLNPKVALSMLKKQFGDYSDTSLEERIPPGMEKCGTHSGNGANFPYTVPSVKKQILLG